ncbi:MAG: glycosyltransferase family 4 protein [Candidatus Competibacteraceae bacterium]
MNHVHFLIPGDLETRTGGYLYDRRIMAGLATLGWRVDLHRLDASFPTPTPAALTEADAILAALPDRMLVVVDGLALGAMPEVAARHRDRLRLVALVHHPLALETGLDEATSRRLYASERESLRHVRRVIVTSPSTARALADYAITSEQCTVVLPGTDPVPLAEGSGEEAWVLLCVASLTPRKGHAVLFRALARLESLPWRLRCVGSADLDPVTAADLRTLAAELGLAGRIEFPGQLEAAALAIEYRGADLLVLPSYYEGYGMALAEALARGLPIISTTAGAIPDTVPADAGLLVPPGDEAALAGALVRVMTEPDLRERLAAGARAARRNLPDWPTACARFATALEAVST